ncbi:MAG: DUF2796 domain-containing protein [Marinagarivorans sp.]|nr:DUF2796 domain-containing protein [Marinagarivorans sp.]
MSAVHSIAVDYQPSALADIYQPDVSMAIWQRHLNARITRYAKHLMTALPHWQTRVIQKPKNVALQLMPILLHLFLFGLCFCCHQGLAQSRLNPEAHTHGLAQMTVLYEAGQLLIELETPAANMLGFEHSPQNSEQWQQLSQLKKSLTDPKSVIDLQPDCKVQNVKVELPFQEKEKLKTPSKKLRPSTLNMLMMIINPIRSMTMISTQTYYRGRTGSNGALAVARLWQISGR